MQQPTRVVVAVHRSLRFVVLVCLVALLVDLTAPLQPTAVARAAEPRPATLVGSPPVARVGQAYSYRFLVGGNPAPTVRLVQGMLPPGVELADDGTLSGMPTLPGTYRFTLTASNRLGDATRDVAITIAEQPLRYAARETGTSARLQQATNLALNQLTTTSGQLCSLDEDGDKAVDGFLGTEWCSTNPSSSWLQIDFGAPTTFDQFVLLHIQDDGISPPTCNTSDFNIATSSDAITWTPRVTVTGNTNDFTIHDIATVTARYIRLNVTRATSAGCPNNLTRLAEFEVYDQGNVLPTPTPTQTATPSATPTATSTATPFPTAIAPFGFVDVGNIRVWATTFTGNGGQVSASGNVFFGRAGQGDRFFRADSASWSDSGPIQAQGVLRFGIGPTAIGQGSFTIDRSNGTVSWGQGSSALLNKLGNSELAITPTITVNVFQPTVQVSAVVVPDLPENQGLTVTIQYRQDRDGFILDSTSVPLTLTMAGARVTTNITARSDGLHSPNPEFRFNDQLLAYLPGLLIDGKGTAKLRIGDGISGFRLGTINLGNNALQLRNTSATLALANNAYEFNLSSQLRIEKVLERSGVLTLDLSNGKLANGGFSGAVSDTQTTIGGLAVTLTGGTLVYDRSKQHSVSFAQSQLALMEAWGSSLISVGGIVITTSELRVSSIGASFPLPDVTLGAASSLQLTDMRAGIRKTTYGSADNVNYAIDIEATVTVTKVQAKGGSGSVSASGSLSIEFNRVYGTVNALAFAINGVEFEASGIAFVDNKLSVAQASLTLPVKSSNVNAVVYGLELGGDVGFRLMGARVQLPDFSIGSVGVRGVTIEFMLQGDAFTVAGAAVFEFTKFSVSGSFKIGYSPASGLSLQSVSLAFEGSIPSPSIPLGNTGFYIIRVSGSFNLEDGSATFTFGLGASTAFRVGNTSLVDIDGSITVQIKPSFALSSNATARLLGIQVASVDLRITSSSFSLKAEARISVIRASLELTFGKDASNQFTFYGRVAADIVIPRNYFSAGIPASDISLFTVVLDGGKFRKDGTTIWGARGQVRVLSTFDLYVWAKFSPGSPEYGLGKRLKDYVPVRPVLAQRLAAAGGDVSLATVTSPADYLVIIERVASVNRAAPTELLVVGPAGVTFSKQLTYEEPGGELRLYRIELADAADARGVWTLETQSGNTLTVQGADPGPQVDSFTACLVAGACLSPDTPLTIEQGTPLELRWSTSGYTPNLTLNIYAINSDGTHYPLASQETSSQNTLANSASWRSALASGTYTVSLVLESDGFAPVTVDQGRVTINDTTPPAAPVGLQVRSEIDRTVVASWDGAAAEDDLAGYQVSVNGGPPIAIDGRLSRYLAFGLAPGATHTVAVAAYDLSGNLGPAATAAVEVPSIAMSAVWPLRESYASNANEVGASFDQPITMGQLTLRDAEGNAVAGTVTPLTADVSVTETVTLGAVFRPDGGALRAGTYIASINATDVASGENLSFSWSFTVAPTRNRIYMPLIRRPG
jgi:hypothetical protein